MFPTVTYPIRANRYTPHNDFIDVVGVDLTDASFAMQVRDARNGGTLRADVVPTVAVTTEGGVTTSRISWFIDEVTMEAMPLDEVRPATDKTFYYDILITPSGGSGFIGVRGLFIVGAGVTQ